MVVKNKTSKFIQLSIVSRCTNKFIIRISGVIIVIIMPALRIIIFSRCTHEKFVIVLSIIKTLSLGKTDRVDDGAALSTDKAYLIVKNLD